MTNQCPLPRLWPYWITFWCACPNGACRDCEAAWVSVQQYISGAVCREDDLLGPKLQKAQSGELPFQETVELIQRLIDQDREAEGSCQEDLDRLDRTLKETFALLGKAQKAEKVREKLEQDRKEREMLVSQAEEAQKALEAEQEKVPRQEAMGKELAALETALPRCQELSNQKVVLTALVERIAESVKKCSQQAEERTAKDLLLSAWKQELDGLTLVDAEQEHLLRERDQAKDRQAALTALKAQIEQ